jgi:hypothetical protein
MQTTAFGGLAKNIIQLWETSTNRLIDYLNSRFASCCQRKQSLQKYKFQPFLCRKRSLRKLTFEASSRLRLLRIAASCTVILKSVSGSVLRIALDSFHRFVSICVIDGQKSTAQKWSGLATVEFLLSVMHWL